MLFHHPEEKLDFEIPDEWIQEVGGLGPQQSNINHYSCASTDAYIVPLYSISAPKRNLGVRWFDKDRSIKILSAMKNQIELPPIECYTVLGSPTAFLSVKNGFHRYYLSIAMGFNEIPVVLTELFDFDNPYA